MKKNKEKLTAQSKNRIYAAAAFSDTTGAFQNPTSDEWRKEFISKAINWAKQENSISLMGFLRQCDIKRMTFYDWVEKYPDVAEAYNEMKLLFADNRMTGAIFKRMDTWISQRGIGLLDPEQHKVNVYEAAFKQKEESKDIQFIVINAKPQVGTKEDLRRNVDDTI